MATKLLDQLLEDIIDDLGGGDVQGLLRVTNRSLRELCKRYPWRFYQEESNFTILAKYDTGTVTLTDGSTTVTGDGTTFTSAMVGRKFRSTLGKGVYTIAAYVSATEITLDVAWPYDTESDLSYEIYQDKYSLPSDCRQVIELVDAVTGYPWQEITHKDRVRNWSGYVFTEVNFSFPESAWPYRWAQYGTDSSGNPEILVNSVGDADRVTDVFYHRWPAEVTTIKSQPDIPEYMEEALYQTILRHYVSRMPMNEEGAYMVRAGRLAQSNGDKEIAIRDAIKIDSTMTMPMRRNKRVFI